MEGRRTSGACSRIWKDESEHSEDGELEPALVAEGGVPPDAALEESAPAPAVPGELLPSQLLAVLQADL